jgi:hypothetical protein
MFVNLLHSFLLCKTFLRNDGSATAGFGCAGVYSKAAGSYFGLGKRASGIAASIAGKRHGNGRGGKRSDTGRLRLASKSATAKASGTGNGSRAANHQSRKR